MGTSFVAWQKPLPEQQPAAASTVEGHIGMVITSAGSARLIKQRYLCFLVNRKLWRRSNEDFSFFGAAGSAGASRRCLGVCAQSRAPSSSSCPALLLPFPGCEPPGVCVKRSPRAHVRCGRRAVGPCAPGNPLGATTRALRNQLGHRGGRGSSGVGVA